MQRWEKEWKESHTGDREIWWVVHVCSWAPKHQTPKMAPVLYLNSILYIWPLLTSWDAEDFWEAAMETAKAAQQPPSTQREITAKWRQSSCTDKKSPIWWTTASYFSIAATCFVSILLLVQRAVDNFPLKSKPSLVIFRIISLTSSPKYNPLIIFSNL